MALCLALLALVCSSHAFGVGPRNTPPVSPLDTQISRPNFLALVGAAVTANACAVSPALAKEDPDVKGTKKDPVFEACLSTCMYECTKPKGSEQKSRKECLPECKEKCATDKKQLMLGEPKKL
eukprot:scaffold8569_cov139-Cylindrotheca_fusiformis.AAC.13